MVVLEPKAWVIRRTEHYKAAKLAIDLKKMHLVDQMDLHRKTGEMIFIKLTIITSNACKLENMVSNVTNQLKQEKIATRIMYMKIDELEQLIIKLGENPKEATSIQDLIKSRDIEIQVLRRKLKMHNIEHLQTPKLEEVQKENEKLLFVIIEMNKRWNIMTQGL